MESNPLTSAEFVIFTTRNYAAIKGISVSAASHQLKIIHSKGWIQPLTRGVWVNPNHPYFTPLSCVPILLGVEQGYVSFLTALHRHGAISQVPRTMQIATTGHSRRLETAFGNFEFFQLKPEMMQMGVEWSPSHLPFRIASPEKALIDTLYIASRKGKRFSSLPQLQMDFKRGKILSLLDSEVKSVRIRSSIRTHLCHYALI